jgi:hypothetical protein
VIVEENHGDKSIINSREASYIHSLASQYSYAAGYYAIGHPSLPNYLIMTSGKDWGIRKSCTPDQENCSTNATNIADLVESAGLSWKAYYEDMPGVCWKSNTDLYYTDYNPFVYYTDISEDENRCAQHDVPLTQLQADLQTTKSLPDLVFISPNSCNDMHNCPISTGDKWLAKTATEILDSPAFTKQNSLLVVTWDESEKKNSDNNIALIMVGPRVRKSYTSQNYYNHIDLLKTIETSWHLPALNDSDANAKTMSEFFN